MISHRARRGRPISLAVLGAIQLISSASSLLPQQVSAPSNRATCATCRIVVTQLAELGDADGPGALYSRPTSIVRDSRGRFFVIAPEGGPSLPQVFGQDGRFIAALGRLGQGPGEYTQPYAIALSAGDTIHVFDLGSRRHSILGPDLKFVRSQPLPGVVKAAIAVPGGGFIVAADVGTPAAVGFPLHRLNDHDVVVASFGPDSLFPGQDLARASRQLSAARDGGLWSARLAHRYEIERWSFDGKLAKRITPKVAWFRPYEASWAPTPTRAPASIVKAVWEDAAHNLWVLGLTADPKWRQGLERGVRREGMMTYGWADKSLIFDSILEVRDGATGALLASRRMPEFMELGVGNGVVAGSIEREDGRMVTRVWQVRLSH